MALNEAAKEGVYLRRFLADLGFPCEPPTAVATDNTGAKSFAYNPEHHERVKHVERRHFYVRELVENGLLTSAICAHRFEHGGLLYEAVTCCSVLCSAKSHHEFRAPRA